MNSEQHTNNQPPRPAVGCEGDFNVSEEAHSPPRGEPFTGFFKLQRRFFNHYLWLEHREFSRAEAFLDLLQLAAYAHTRRLVKGVLLDFLPGQLCGSERYLATRWNWSTKKVRNFLALLEVDHMVIREKKREGSKLTIVNYESYNDGGITKEAPKTQTGSTLEAARSQIKEVEEGKEGEESFPPAAAGGATPPKGSDQSQADRVLPSAWKRMNQGDRQRTRVLRNSEAMVRIGRFFGRKPTTLWTVAEAVAFLSIKPTPDEVDEIERYYKAAIPKDHDYRRHDLDTLLNNWPKELDRAKTYKANQIASQ